jgi:hypothetical protein
MGGARGGPALAPMFQGTASRVRFPANFDQMVMYGNYRRGSGGELAYALRETIDAAKAGQPLPPGTVLVLELYRENVLSEYFVMEKGAGWGLDFPEETRNGDWHFQQFGLNKQVSGASNPGRCMSCHGGQTTTDFMFTLDRMRDYAP